MSNELENAYTALSRDADRARLAPAADLRRRAARQTVARSAAGLVAITVLATGAAGAGFALAGNYAGLPTTPAASATTAVSPSPGTPAPSASPTPSAPASSAPASSAPPSTSTPGVPPIPKSIPARALLTEAEGNVDPAVRQDTARKLTLCPAAKFPSAELVGVRASVLLLYRPAEQDEGYVPEDVVYNTVTVYRGNGAAGFLDDLGAAVQACPEGKVGDRTAKFRSLGSLGLRDGSLLVERSTAAFGDDGSPAQGRRLTYFAAVRVGDAITLLETTGYESGTTDLADVKLLARAAGDRLAAWRP